MLPVTLFWSFLKFVRCSSVYGENGGCLRIWWQWIISSFLMMFLSIEMRLSGVICFDF